MGFYSSVDTYMAWDGPGLVSPNNCTWYPWYLALTPCWVNMEAFRSNRQLCRTLGVASPWRCFASLLCCDSFHWRVLAAVQLKEEQQHGRGTALSRNVETNWRRTDSWMHQLCRVALLLGVRCPPSHPTVVRCGFVRKDRCVVVREHLPIVGVLLQELRFQYACQGSREKNATPPLKATMDGFGSLGDVIFSVERCGQLLGMLGVSPCGATPPLYCNIPQQTMCKLQLQQI